MNHLPEEIILLGYILLSVVSMGAAIWSLRSPVSLRVYRVVGLALWSITFAIYAFRYSQIPSNLLNLRKGELDILHILNVLMCSLAIANSVIFTRVRKHYANRTIAENLVEPQDHVWPPAPTIRH